MLVLQGLSHFLDLRGLLLLLFLGELGRVGCRACPAEAPIALATTPGGTGCESISGYRDQERNLGLVRTTYEARAGWVAPGCTPSLSQLSLLSLLLPVPLLLGLTDMSSCVPSSPVETPGLVRAHPILRVRNSGLRVGGASALKACIPPRDLYYVGQVQSFLVPAFLTGETLGVL